MSYVTKPIAMTEIKKQLTDIKKASKDLHDLIQSVALQALIQLLEHRNATVAFNLVNAIGNNALQKQLRKYFEDHAPLKRQFKGRSHIGYTIDKDMERQLESEREIEHSKDKCLVVDIVQAEQINFWDYQVKVEPQEYTLESGFTSANNMIKKWRKYLTENEFNQVKELIATSEYVDGEPPVIQQVAAE